MQSSHQAPAPLVLHIKIVKTQRGFQANLKKEKKKTDGCLNRNGLIGMGDMLLEQSVSKK
jgi:hypothetical protein